MFTCKKCRRRARIRLWPFRCVCGCRYEHSGDKGTCSDIAAAQRDHYVWPPNGVGTILKAMLAEIGAKVTKNCGCNGVARQMNVWGPFVCRKNRKWIAERLKENASKQGWLEVARLSMSAARASWLTAINPLDPFGSLVDIAIRRAEKMP